MSTTISCTDPNFTVSPYNWASITIGSTPAISTANIGAFIDFSFSGTSATLNIDTSSMNQAGYIVQVFYSVDGGALVQAPNVVYPNTTIAIATGLSNTTHTLLVWCNNLFGNEDLWPGALALTVTGITLDTGGTITASLASNLPYLIEYGDSTMMGVQSQAYGCFGTQIASLLRLRSGNCAFSGQGWTTGVIGTSPGLVAGWQSIFNGQSRTFSPAPQILLNNMGENQSVVASTVTTWLGNVRSVLPNAYINQLMPFNQSPSNVPTNITQIKLGYANYIAANPSENRMNVIDLSTTGQTIINNSTYSPDGTHPNLAGCALLASIVAPQIIGAAQQGNSPSFSPRIGRY